MNFPSEISSLGSESCLGDILVLCAVFWGFVWGAFEVQERHAAQNQKTRVLLTFPWRVYLDTLFISSGQGIDQR